MNADQVSKLYSAACESYGRLPNDAQFKAWADSFTQFNQAEVAAAFACWQQDASDVELGGVVRPRGAIFPTPADLLALIKYARREDREKRNRYQPPGPADEIRASDAYGSEEAYQFRRKLWAICNKGEPPPRGQATFDEAPSAKDRAAGGTE